MATPVRNQHSLKIDALMAEYNKLRLDLMKIKAGTIFHMDAGTPVSTANASNEATLVALANALKVAYNAHVASTCSATTGQGAHMADASAGAVATANATDTASANTLLNAIKAAYNTHRASAVFHPTADGTNAVSSADGTDEASGITLANEIKTDLNAHMAAACGHQALNVVAA
jgi:hypothetical protein